jgi:CRP/FNR family transcriptional regulator, anaerobic regulatory protein
MENLLRFLDSVHPMTEQLITHLSRTIREREVRKLQYILRAGHVSRHVHFIGSGLLRCFYIRGEAEVCSWFMKEGDVIISIESFYDQKESYESIQALEDCSLFYIDYTELQYIYRNFPEFNFIGRVLTEKYHKLWAQQLYGIRMQQAPERYKWLLDNFPELVLRVPAKYIASYLGITEVTLSNIKSRK